VSAGWLAYVLAVGGLLAASAALLDAGLRLRHLPTRGVWLGALLLTVGLAATAPLRSSTAALPVTVVMENAGPPEAMPVESAGRPSGWLASIAVVRELSHDVLRTANEAITALPLSDARRWLLTTWLVLSAFLGLGLTVGALRVRRARRGWPAIEVDGAPARLSPSLGPLVLGVIRPEIVIPRWLLAVGEGERRLILTHEREHVHARDPLILGLGWLAVIALPWHPAVWWMLARLRLAVELDCDRRVLRSGADRAAYGDVLLGVAERRLEPVLGSAALLDRRSHLERRLTMMVRRSPRHPTAAAIGLATLATGLVFAACATDMPTAADIQAMDVEALEERVLVSGPLGLGEVGFPVRYFIDGTEVTAEAARALEPDQIASVAVLRARQGVTASAVIIHTEEVERHAIPDALRSQPGEGLQLMELVPRDPAMGPGAAAAVASIAGERAADRDQRVRVRFHGPGDQPLFLVVEDDRERRITPAELGRISPDRIESIEVLKDRAATARYDDPEAENGVVRVKLRSGSDRPADEEASSERSAEPVRNRAIGYTPGSADGNAIRVIEAEAVWNSARQ
jgi:hypothetical protein